MPRRARERERQLCLDRARVEVKMKNIQHSDYGRTLLAYCDACYQILDAEKQLYYQCLTCTNYIVCINCVPDIRNNHWPWHRFVARRGIPAEMTWIHMNAGITCNCCQQVNFVGHRFQCIDCRDFDVCHRCSAAACRTHRLKLASNPQKAEMNRQLLAQRAVHALTDRSSPFYGHQTDFVTGWSLAEARAVLAEYQICRQPKSMSSEHASMTLRRKLEELKVNKDHSHNERLLFEPLDEDDDDDEDGDLWKDETIMSDENNIDGEEFQRRHGLRRLGESPVCDRSTEERSDEERLTGKKRK